MNFSASINIVQNGVGKDYQTNVNMLDIQRNGIAWCEVVRRALEGNGDLVSKLATLLNVATVCHAQGKYIDELAALRIARRIANGRFAPVNELLESRSAAGHFPMAADDRLRIVSFTDDGVEFRQLLGQDVICNNFVHPGAVFGGLLGVEGQAILQNDDSVDNVSFAVCKGKQLLAVVPCVIHSDNVISWVAPIVADGGIPISIHFVEPLCDKRMVLDLVLRYLEHLLRSYGAKEYVIKEASPEELLLYQLLSKQHAFSAEVWDRPVLDLNQSEESIFQVVRKSYKSHINWGKSNLVAEYLSGAAIDNAAVERIYQAIQLCHQKVISKYGDGLTAELFMQPIVLCQRGFGEVAIYRTQEGTVCGVTVTTIVGDVAYYALGGSIPQGNKNPGQYVVYNSILRAKARGAHTYSLNRDFSAPISMDRLQLRVKSQHDMNLIFFKRGFAGQLQAMNVYKVMPLSLGLLGRD